MALETRTSTENEQTSQDVVKQQILTDIQTYTNALPDPTKASLVTSLAPKIVEMLALDGKYNLQLLHQQKVLQAFFEPATNQLLTAMQTNLQP